MRLHERYRSALSLRATHTSASPHSKQTKSWFTFGEGTQNKNRKDHFLFFCLLSAPMVLFQSSKVSVALKARPLNSSNAASQLPITNYQSGVRPYCRTLTSLLQLDYQSGKRLDLDVRFGQINRLSRQYIHTYRVV